MQESHKLIKPLTEVKYLNADNVSRYRCIMRIFFENYEKLKYWLYQEEVYEEMIKDPLWEDYKLEQCQQDLSMLTEWKNLNTIQDTRKVTSIEEFRNKKYRYQMSEYSVEIERLVLRLENLFIEGSSLEPTLLERIRIDIERMPDMANEESSKIYTWWTDLNNDFIRLNQNYQDYIRDLNSVKAEEMMRTKEFLIFKDRLIEYLRSFIKGLQRNVGVIEECLRFQDEELHKKMIQKRIELESLGEELRVLYVALTRAKEKLILTGTLKNAMETVENAAKDKAFYERGRYESLCGGTSFLDWILEVSAGEKTPFRTSFVTVESLVSAKIERAIEKKYDYEMLRSKEEDLPEQLKERFEFPSTPRFLNDSSSSSNSFSCLFAISHIILCLVSRSRNFNIPGERYRSY